MILNLNQALVSYTQNRSLTVATLPVKARNLPSRQMSKYLLLIMKKQESYTVFSPFVKVLMHTSRTTQHTVQANELILHVKFSLNYLPGEEEQINEWTSDA